MLGRCNNPNNTNYKNYGARGIKIDPVWNTFKIFKLWAISAGYTDALQIDRIDNNLGYSPSNCRWTKQAIKVRNINKLKG